MLLFEKLRKVVTRVVGSNCSLQRGLLMSCTSSYRCTGSKVNADDLRSLPEKPKKPLTPYFRFMAEMRPEMRKDYPNYKTTEIVKLVADKWDKAPEEAKEKYLEEYKKELISYTNSKAKYDSQLTDEHKELMKKAKNEMNVIKENRKLKKKMKDLGKPKRPGSPFIMFFNTKLSSKGQTPHKDWVRTVAKEWSNMPPELKVSFQKEFSSAMEIHRRQIQEWEERMIRMGHIDVVRSEALIEPKMASRKILRTKLIGKHK